MALKYMLTTTHSCNFGERWSTFYKGDIVYPPGIHHPTGSVCGWQGQLGAIMLPLGEFEKMNNQLKLQPIG